jgi:hypothetical protein
MNKLWHYGDSYATCGEFETIFSQYIANHYGLKLNYLAAGGLGNFEIFSRVISNDSKYEVGDVILINWSFFSRNTLTTIDGELIGVDNLLVNFPKITESNKIDLDAKNFLIDSTNNWNFIDSVKLFNYIIHPYIDGLTKRGVIIKMIFLEQTFPDNTNVSLYYNKFRQSDKIITDRFNKWVLKFEPYYPNWFVSRDLMKGESSHYAKGIQEMMAEEYIKRMG